MPTNYKKILIICPFVRPNLGGVESHIDKLLSFITSNNYEATVITYQPLTVKTRGAKHEQGQKFEIYRQQWFGWGLFNKLENYFPLQFLYLFPGLFYKSLSYYVRYHKDIHCLHAHGLVAAAIAKVLQKIHPIHIVVSTHAVYNFSHRKLLSLIVKNILEDMWVLAVSEIARAELLKIGLKPSKVGIHPNWVETNIFKPKDKSECQQALKVTEPLNVLFGVGRLIEKKGVLLFLETVKQLPHIGFHIVGQGPLEDSINAVAKKHHNLHFYGTLRQQDQQEREKLICLYSLCELVVSPYLYEEGFSATLIEAAACGTPLLVTRRGSPPKFLDDSFTYYLSPAPTATELSNTLREILNKNEELKQKAIKAREYALKHYGESNAQIILDYYEKTK